jgi:fibronectin type 3 domain-containing protein
LYRQATGSTALETIRVPAAIRLVEDGSVQTGQTYLYWITAVDAAGNESARSTPDTLLMRDFTPPRSVRNARARGSDGGDVSPHWEPVPALDLAGYRVYRAALATGPFLPAHQGLLDETQWVDRSGQRGAWYQVRAVDRSGNESLPGAPIRAAQPSGN